LKSENQRCGAAVGGIVATLSGSDTCTALGVTAQSSSPVLLLCRHLTDAGHDPATPMQVFRGETLALTVRAIGEAARLEINAYGTGFRPRREADAAPPVRPPRLVGVVQRAKREAA
jgi:hypothetical protein